MEEKEIVWIQYEPPENWVDNPIENWVINPIEGEQVTCPECGSENVFMAGHCFTCYTCGWSVCAL